MSLVLKGINKSFFQGSEEIKVLKGLAAEIQDGEVVAIVGQSGSGKSTLLSLMSGLDHPDAGEVIVKGKDIAQLSQNEITQFRAQNIGIVFQQFHLMAHLTALENVMLPLEILRQKNPAEAAKECLAKMDLGHRLNHFPSQLSGGECQRVAIARALVVKPTVLLADEPSGNLDVQTGSRVMSGFFEAVREQKVTTILVTHSELIAQQCDRALVLKNGVLE